MNMVQHEYGVTGTVTTAKRVYGSRRASSTSRMSRHREHSENFLRLYGTGDLVIGASELPMSLRGLLHPCNLSV